MYATDAVEGDKLKKLAEAGAKTKRLDVTSQESISAFKESFGDQPLDFLLNIAGSSALFYLFGDRNDKGNILSGAFFADDAVIRHHARQNL